MAFLEEMMNDTRCYVNKNAFHFSYKEKLNDSIYIRTSPCGYTVDKIYPGRQKK